MKHVALAFCGALWLFPAMAAPSLRLDSRIEMQMDDPRFGGFSSLEVAADGMSFMATSDRGTLLRGDIIRVNGRMTGVENLRLSAILDTKGRPTDRNHTDAEGLAVGADGTIYMSFESNHRVMVQDGPEALPVFVPKHPDFRSLITNSGLEALAIDEAGGLYAIPERSGDLALPFPVYRLEGDAWRKDWFLPRSDDFLVSGADIFAGQLYILERKFQGIWGFASRIRRFDIGADTGETLLTTEAGQFDNLEGIALWQPAGEAPRVLLISDDNFLFLQDNQLVEMVLEE